MMGTNRSYPLTEMGKFTPKMTIQKVPFEAGEVGYFRRRHQGAG